MTTDNRYSIGIDLGTTNSALAAFDHSNEEQQTAETFGIAQVIDQNVVDARNTLPSFLYIPSEHEASGDMYKLPWNEAPAHLVGAHARDQGEKQPQRLIHSAKSWLCVPDGRHNENLPLSAHPEVKKLSAIQASANYLGHLRDTWNHEHGDDPIQSQDLVITVPASFDVVARDLTMEAAHQAEFKDVTLLEEPIAAFYAWLADHQEDWRKIINVGDVVLVCDIGGGTTDFSLISVEEEEGNLTLSRIAVGEHILLGGDNMDLALARKVQLKLQEEGRKLEQWQFFGLAHSCRKAKETLLADESLDQASVVIPGRGSKLIGSTISSELTRHDMQETLLEGFLGSCGVHDHPQVARRMGLRTIGLNYASDSSILKHLAKFLAEGKKFVDPSSDLGQVTESRQFLHPTAILFNGGVTQAGIFRQRVIDTVNQWLQEDGGEPIKTLELDDTFLAVSRGAAYYGSVRRGKGVRVKSATVFSYYIGVESAMPAVPGMPPLMNGLCVLPTGVEEGSSFEIPGSEFGLVVGETVDFRFFISRERPNDESGTTVEDAESHLEELSTLEIHLPIENAGEGSNAVIPVRLRVSLTELGALEIWCDAIDQDRSWKLEFNLRED